MTPKHIQDSYYRLESDLNRLIDELNRLYSGYANLNDSERVEIDQKGERLQIFINAAQSEFTQFCETHGLDRHPIDPGLEEGDHPEHIYIGIDDDDTYIVSEL
jgi:hypothetical protein